MPGLVIFRRRWSVGSDDLVVPAIFLIVLHTVWLAVLGFTLGFVPFDRSVGCLRELQEHLIVYVVLLCAGIMVEVAIAWVSLRGSIVNAEPRASMPYLLYVRLGLLIVEFAWLVVGIVRIVQFHSITECVDSMAKKVVLGVVASNWIILISVLVSIFCLFDRTGRTFVKLKYYDDHGATHRTAGCCCLSTPSPNKRTRLRTRSYYRRKFLTSHEKKWDKRMRCFFCCLSSDNNKKSSFKEVALLFAEYFREIDVVLTDVIAGLILLRRQQKIQQTCLVNQSENEVYRFLSGSPVTPKTKFLKLKDPEVLCEYKKVIHFMRYALACYGWPAYVFMHPCTGTCRVLPYIRCTCCCFNPCRSYRREHLRLVDDNCCQCNYAALKKIAGLSNLDIVYVTYYDDIGQTPFFVALDHTYKKVVISIRGTLSLKDVITDLKAGAEQLPVSPPQESWLGHKGTVHAASYIKKKLIDEMILPLAFGRDRNKGTEDYGIVIVGHSLGAGVASVLAILLQDDYPNLHCYAYSPPGGLLSSPAVEYTKSFVTSVVLGKDVVPRMGLFQMEAMRSDVLSVIKRCRQPKWKIIGKSVTCCSSRDIEEGAGDALQQQQSRNRMLRGTVNTIVSSNPPLHLPGTIIHIVRTRPRDTGTLCHNVKPVYQAIWADNASFNEVLISPKMITDHMPDKVLSALEKVLLNAGPKKPCHKLPEHERKALLSDSGESPVHVAEGGDNQCNKRDSELSWDYTTLDDMGLGKSDHKPLETQTSFTIDLFRNEWGSSAPMATAESLSDSSSIDSNSSRQIWIHGAKSADLVDRLETINQSPVRQPEFKFKLVPVAQSTPMPDSDQNKVITRATVEPNIPVLSSSTLVKEGTDNVETPTMSSDHKEGLKLNLNDSGVAVYDKIKKSESRDNYKLTFEEDSMCEEPDDYLPHSPEFSNQVEYDDFRGHYSAGGRGYPHGGYQGNQSESDGQLGVTESENPLLRSREEEDVARLHDKVEVFKTGNGRFRHYSSPELNKKPLEIVDSACLENTVSENGMVTALDVL